MWSFHRTTLTPFVLLDVLSVMQLLSDSIHQLASESRSRTEFCQRLLEEVAVVLQAEAGLLWDASTAPLQPVAQYSLTGQPAKIPLSQESHSKLLLDAIEAEQPLLLRANTQQPDAVPSLLVVGKIDFDGLHLIELFVSKPAIDDKQLASAFSDLLLVISGAVENLPSFRLGNESGGTSTAQSATLQLSQDQVSDYLNTIHNSIDRSATCSNVANETRRLLACDRVSVVLRHRGSFRIFSISGQPSVNRRSNTTKLLEKLAKRLLKTGQSFWYPNQNDVPTQIGEVLDEYLSISATRSLVVEPIFEKTEESVTDPESLDRKRNLVVGGIVYEHCHELLEGQQIESILNFTSLHGGNAIRNAKRHHNLFLYPVLNFLGKSRVITATRLLPKTLMVCAGVLLALLVLIFWRVDFYVTADGVLVPEEIRPVFSKTDGDVSRLLVQHGSAVKLGDKLLQLTSREHEIRAKDLESKIRSTKQRLEMIQDQMFQQNNDDSRSVQENIEALKAQISNYREQEVILNEIGESMLVTSPLDGQVITWDLEQRLKGRAIQRGQELMEIAAIDDSWQLEIELPVNRYCHLIREMQGTPQPKVSFLLAADTSKRYYGKIVEVEATASLNSSNEQFIRLTADIEASDLHIEQARTGVTTKIFCGRTGLGYLLLHDIGEFLQKNALFYLR